MNTNKIAILFFSVDFMECIICWICSCHLCLICTWRDAHWFGGKNRRLRSYQSAETKAVDYFQISEHWIFSGEKESAPSVLHIESCILLSNMNYPICLTESVYSYCQLNMSLKECVENIVMVAKNVSFFSDTLRFFSLWIHWSQYLLKEIFYAKEERQKENCEFVRHNDVPTMQKAQNHNCLSNSSIAATKYLERVAQQCEPKRHSPCIHQGVCFAFI